MTEKELNSLKYFICYNVWGWRKNGDMTGRCLVFMLWCLGMLAGAIGTTVNLLETSQQFLGRWLYVDAVLALFYPAVLISFGLIVGANQTLLVARRQTPRALQKKIGTSQTKILELEAELELDTSSYP